MKLVKFLSNNNGKPIDYPIENYYMSFGYDLKEAFEYDLNYLINNFFPETKIISTCVARPEQDKFRDELINLYKKCVVSGNTSKDELEACHIVPFCFGGKSNVNNGLLLEITLHRTYDKFAWSINPNSLQIVINPNSDVTRIKEYNGKKVNLNITPELLLNLNTHWIKFKKMC